MRIVVFLLLLANLTLLGYTMLDAGSGEGVRLSQQVQPDKIKLMTAREVAALGPAKVAALADVCVEFGPFSDAERTRVLADLEPLALGRLLNQRRVDVENTYSVIVSPFPSKAAADGRIADLRRQGARDMTVIETGRGQFAVSFGVFRTEAGAVALVEELSRLGVRLAKVQPRQQTLSQTLLVVRDPQQEVVAKLKDLLPQYAGTEIRVATCAAAS
jgi:hypothetical protein